MSAPPQARAQRLPGDSFTGFGGRRGGLVSTLASASASAVQSAELYRTDAFFYGRFEARVQFAPGDGVVSSFFLWKDGSSSTTSWNELDYEKVNAACQLQTNIWSGTGTQSPQLPSITADLCGGYHTYTFEWTPDYIAWFVDGTQLRRETGSVVAEYTQNAAQGMAIHFNVWVGNAIVRRGPRPFHPAGERIHRLGPVLVVREWHVPAAVARRLRRHDHSRRMGGRELAITYGLSTHNPANVNFVNGVAVLSMTADDATGYSGTPPADSRRRRHGRAALRTQARRRRPPPAGGCGCDSLDGGRLGASGARRRHARNRGRDASATALEPLADQVAGSLIRGLVDAHPVDLHRLGEGRGRVRRTRPSPAHRHVEDDEERLVELPGAVRSPPPASASRTGCRRRRSSRLRRSTRWRRCGTRRPAWRRWAACTARSAARRSSPAAGMCMLPWLIDGSLPMFSMMSISPHAGQFTRVDVGAEHPERGPEPLPLRHLDARLEAAVLLA